MKEATHPGLGRGVPPAAARSPREPRAERRCAGLQRDGRHNACLNERGNKPPRLSRTIRQPGTEIVPGEPGESLRDRREPRETPEPGTRRSTSSSGLRSSRPLSRPELTSPHRPAPHRAAPLSAAQRRPRAAPRSAPPFRPHLRSAPAPSPAPSLGPTRCPSRFRFPFIFYDVFYSCCFFSTPPPIAGSREAQRCSAVPGAAPASPHPGGCRRDVRGAGRLGSRQGAAQGPADRGRLRNGVSAGPECPNVRERADSQVLKTTIMSTGVMSYQQRPPKARTYLQFSLMSHGALPPALSCPLPIWMSSAAEGCTHGWRRQGCPEPAEPSQAARRAERNVDFRGTTVSVCRENHMLWAPRPCGEKGTKDQQCLVFLGLMSALRIQPTLIHSPAMAPSQ